MNGKCRLDCFDFDDNLVLNEEVESVTAVKDQTLVVDRNDLLGNNSETSLL